MLRRLRLWAAPSPRVAWTGAPGDPRCGPDGGAGTGHRPGRGRGACPAATSAADQRAGTARHHRGPEPAQSGIWPIFRDDNVCRRPGNLRRPQAPLATAPRGGTGVVCPYPHLAGVVRPSPRYPAGMTAATITKRGANVHDSGHCTASHISSHASPAGAGHRGIHALLSGTSDAIVADALRCAPVPHTQSRRRADPYCAKQDEYAISQPKPNPLRHLRQRPLYASRKRPRIGNSAITGMASWSGLNRNIWPTHGTPARSTGPRRSATGTATLPVSRHIPVRTARLTHATRTLPHEAARRLIVPGPSASPGRGGLTSGTRPSAGHCER